MPVPTIEWVGGIDGSVRIIDQTLLPLRKKFIYLRDVKAMQQAIRRLQVRGAPALGIAAAFGILLGLKRCRAKDYKELKRQIKKTAKYLATARPTAVNLFWGLKRMETAAEKHKEKSVAAIRKALLAEALRILDQDKAVCRRIARNGARLIKKKMRILTHCNAGGLATADYGTALGILFRAKKEGKNIEVYVDETRPLLQGARLTTWELMEAGIKATLITDNMAGMLMSQRRIDCVLVGADRIARNGDAANKIGTYTLAVLARAHRIPFYIAAPVSTFDLSIKSGEEIPIEERPPHEVREVLGRRIAPRGVEVYNPAFDVTPARLISAIITEKGIIHRPNATKIKKALGSS